MMNGPERVFAIANAIVLVGWLALVLAPLRRPLLVLVARIAAAAVAGIYVTLLVRGLVAGPGLPEGAGFATLAGVEALFASRAAILGGWVHFLAFDLFVASWAVEDAPRAGVPHLLVVPAILLTLLAGPAGLLLYLVVAGGFRLAGRGRPGG